MINEEVLEPIFSACKTVNNQILNQYNEDEYKLTFVDHYMFQNSSYLFDKVERKDGYFLANGIEKEL